LEALLSGWISTRRNALTSKSRNGDRPDDQRVPARKPDPANRKRMPEKITVEEANRLSEHEFAERFGPLYEHSPWVAEEAWKARPFGSLDELHGAMVEAVDAAPEERKMDLIRAHPDLAGRAAIAGVLTPESTREQSSAGLDRLTPEEYEALTRLNREYWEKFGFPLVIAVREHTKETILADAAARLQHSRSEEIETALSEIAKIAYLRLQDLVEPAPDEAAGAKGDR
jgi:2-oxo-4-hydroxy-4-carboxy-5-ureidoimidazoline decarboxylase